MHPRQFIKALVWCCRHPIVALRRGTTSGFLRFAGGARPSVRLEGRGKLILEGLILVDRGTLVQIAQDACLRLGADVFIADECELTAGRLISIGASTSLQRRSTLIGDVCIGAGCVLAPNLYASSFWHHFDDEPALPIRLQDRISATEGSASIRSQPVVIGDDCWLGINVVVAPGVTIGRGCVVGANSVVTRDLAPYTVSVGSPARSIRPRLAFQPPRRIDASQAGQIPYFYSGFDVIEKTSAMDRRWGSAEFCLALDLRGADRVSLDVQSVKGGLLCHRAQEMSVPAGRSTVSFAVDATQEAYLEFGWSARQAGERLEVFSVEALSS